MTGEGEVRAGWRGLPRGRPFRDTRRSCWRSRWPAALLALGLQAGRRQRHVRQRAPRRASRPPTTTTSTSAGTRSSILVREPLTDLVETKDLATRQPFSRPASPARCVVADQQLASFTPAPAGLARRRTAADNSPCGKLMKAQPVQVVYGPGTFLNRAVAAVNTRDHARCSTSAQQAVTSAEQRRLQARDRPRPEPRRRRRTVANAAGTLKQQQELQQLEQLYLNSGISGTPSIDDPQFIPQIVFDQTRGVNQPKARFAYLFPTANSALIQVRLKASLSDAQQAQRDQLDPPGGADADVPPGRTAARTPSPACRS